MPMPQLDPMQDKADPGVPEKQEQLKAELEMRMMTLEKDNPEWFRYSDTLGERPIDGMVRELRNSWELEDLRKTQQNDYAVEEMNRVRNNRRVAPQYTEERQQGVAPDSVRVMGQVM